MQTEVFGRADNLLGVGSHGFLGAEGFVGVFDAEATTGVDVGEMDAVSAELLDKGGHAVEGGAEGVHGADLRADVDADTGRDEPLRLGGLAVDGARGVDVDAELVGA